MADYFGGGGGGDGDQAPTSAPTTAAETGGIAQNETAAATEDIDMIE